MDDQEEKILSHVKGTFGWHGGVGDPPDDDTVLAIIRGTLDYVDNVHEKIQHQMHDHEEKLMKDKANG